jgi:hypothetical protein
MSTPSLPIWAIILDVFGTVLIAGGIFVLVSGGELLGAPAGELRGLAIGMIVVGAMLMVPLVVAVIQRAASQSRR